MIARSVGGSSTCAGAHCLPNELQQDVGGSSTWRGHILAIFDSGAMLGMVSYRAGYK
jgi:hypothetical protein